MKRVFLCGEGPHDIGGWAKDPTWRASDKGHVDRGVAEALMYALAIEGWEIIDGEAWKNLRGRFSAGSARAGQHRDKQNVLIAARRAVELGADVLVIMRDSDGDSERAGAVRDGMGAVSEANLRVGGGPAEPCLEAWIVAINGDAGSQALTKSAAQTKCAAIATRAADMVALIERCGVAKISADATSLNMWLESTRAALSA